jgi:hypothetical protein
MTITVTIDQLKNDYKNYLQAENSAINAFAPNSSWSVLAGGTSGVFLDLYYNLQLLTNSIYVQNAVGDQIDQWLYRQGLPARGGETFAYVLVTITPAVVTAIPVNTQFTDSVTGNVYQNLLEIPIGATSATLYSTKSGNNYLEPTGAILTNNTINVVVTTSVNGQVEESDQSCITRILTALRSPVSGSRETDYQVYALDFNTTLISPVVTNSIPIVNFTVINNVGVFGLFAMGGTPITEYQLNLGLLPATAFVEFSRALDSATVIDLNNYIQSLRLVGLTIEVGTVITQVVATNALPLSASVSLVPGYSMDTILTIPSQDVNDNPISIQISVADLIKREIRRAITTQQFGGTMIGSNNYITLDSIYYSVNLQLSYLNGALAQILTNMVIAGGDISVPNASYSLTNLFYIYDIQDYTAITLTHVG